jgi:hypothetical protein
MEKIAKMAVVVTMALSAGYALAQGTTGIANGNGTPGSGPSGTITGPISSPGVGTTPSTTAGIGNGNNPGYGNMSDPSVRMNPGIDANGPCNGARSTSGNNTPSC